MSTLGTPRFDPLFAIFGAAAFHGIALHEAAIKVDATREQLIDAVLYRLNTAFNEKTHEYDPDYKRTITKCLERLSSAN
jgi:hypothetical protein